MAKSDPGQDPVSGPGISVKLSALHPRFEMARRERVLTELGGRLLAIARAAKAANIGMTVDAEEAARLELTLELFEQVLRDSSLAGWDGFGIVVQCYQRRGLASLELLREMARAHDRRLMVRLVKGAYWDSEI
ncbi:MAG: proline dehydrogenase family protein, partial [Pseudomonadota bacterium]|nr:proline dehydrogenase family protein [Pseudomonadota bacterium]